MSVDSESDITERFRRTIERRDRAIGTQRIGDLNKLFACRYGGNRESYIFPDDDAGLEDLKILLHHYALNNPLAMPRIVELRAPWLDQPATARLFEQIDAFPQKWRADTLGLKLNLTGAEWRTLRLRTIAPVDMTRQQRVAFSQAIARQRRKPDAALWAKNRELNIWPRVSGRRSPGWPSRSAGAPGTDAESLLLRPVAQVWTQ